MTHHWISTTVRYRVTPGPTSSGILARHLSERRPDIAGIRSAAAYGRQTADTAVASVKSLVQTEDITRAILVLRGHRVLLDTELAALYGVTTKRFNEQVRRNAKRFPADFMFQLTAEEISSLRSQFATLKLGRGQHRKYLPYVFTEHGAIMAATILNSSLAVEMSVYVVRAFVQLRELLASNTELARRFAQLETRLDKNSPPTMKPSPPSSRPFASSCTRRCQSADPSVSPPTSTRRRSQESTMSSQ